MEKKQKATKAFNLKQIPYFTAWITEKNYQIQREKVNCNVMSI